MAETSNQYFDTKRYEVLENKTMILVFKKTWWHGHLIDWKGFSKQHYEWIEDDKGQMNIIKKIDETATKKS